MTQENTTTLPPISSIADHVGGSCEDGYLVQFILTDEAEYRAWMAWLRGQRIKGLEAAPVFSMAADPQTTKPEAEWKAEYRAYMVRCLTGAPGWSQEEAEKCAAYTADCAWENDPTEDPEDSAQSELECMCDG